jgi:hypothetical protein
MTTRWLPTLTALLALSASARAAVPVDLALVLVDDVSLSIDDDEFALQKQGWQSAFTDPRVVSAIAAGTKGAIAVQYEEFASDYEVQVVVPWTLVHDAASARAFAAAVSGAPRSARGRTAIGEGVAMATAALVHAPFAAQRKVIDVCGDGTNNAGRPATEARDAALAQNITINGLAIANESAIPYLQRHTHPPGGLAHYYETNVTGGEGSFVLEIHDYNSFAAAVLRKLLNEIARNAPLVPRAG